MLLLTVAGCGGANVAYREVPGGPVNLDVPGDGAAIGGAATPTPTAEADAEETPEGEEGADAATSQPEETPAPDAAGDEGAADGGAEAPPAQEPDDTAPPAETPDAGLDDYCAANPGAC
ncbi:hypothetical protein [Solirubrobacter deserti]|uniref:Uncharacterized protein n=1 Tax=Solirubrobacter deserti TaxID=2282478 RepID=A0ABT4RIG4_9ACTN|nr:hypothetical protein [Solirubrobacter deserti]MDA0138326.1 hypothetical protein [Solirubrobacter deserti]